MYTTSKSRRVKKYAVNRLAADPAEASRFGVAGRRRAVDEFGWDAVAEKTVELYRSLL